MFKISTGIKDRTNKSFFENFSSIQGMFISHELNHKIAVYTGFYVSIPYNTFV